MRDNGTQLIVFQSWTSNIKVASLASNLKTQNSKLAHVFSFFKFNIHGISLKCFSSSYLKSNYNQESQTRRRTSHHNSVVECDNYTE